MPVPYLTKLAKKHGVPLAIVEKKWDKAKKLADDAGQGKNYAYITGIMNRMIGENSSTATRNAPISYEVYCSALNSLEYPGTEIAITLPGLLGHLVDHLQELMRELTEGLKIGVADIVKALKSKSVFQLLKSIGFNLKVLGKAFLKPAATGPQVLTKLMKDLESSGWLEKLKSGAETVDSFLKANPVIARIGGVGIAALLLAMWLNTMFTGSPRHDLDVAPILSALVGKFDLVDLFTSPEGLSSIIILFANLSGASAFSQVSSLVVWLGSDMSNLLLALVYTGAVKAREGALVKKIKPYLRRDPAALEKTVSSTAGTRAILNRLSLRNYGN